MNENSDVPGNKRNIWMRGLFMLLMGLTFHVCGTVLCIVTVNCNLKMLTTFSMCPALSLCARPKRFKWLS